MFQDVCNTSLCFLDGSWPRRLVFSYENLSGPQGNKTAGNHFAGSRVCSLGSLCPPCPRHTTPSSLQEPGSADRDEPGKRTFRWRRREPEASFTSPDSRRGARAGFKDTTQGLQMPTTVAPRPPAPSSPPSLLPPSSSLLQPLLRLHQRQLGRTRHHSLACASRPRQNPEWPVPPPARHLQAKPSRGHVEQNHPRDLAVLGPGKTSRHPEIPHDEKNKRPTAPQPITNLNSDY